MGFIAIGNNLYGDPTEGSQKAVERDLVLRCGLCNDPAPQGLLTTTWMCERCHAVM